MKRARFFGPASLLAVSALSVAAAETTTIRLSVGPGGFSSQTVNVTKGPVRIVVEAREGDHCFAIPSMDIERRVRPSKPLTLDITFDEPGDVAFGCCVDPNETGKIVVSAPRK